jgi:tape measure domain-containing protein
VAVATVDIQVNSQGAVSALRQTAAASRQLETAVSNTTTQVGNQNKQMQTAANGMRYFTDAAGRARAENGRFLSTAEKAAAGIKNQTEEVNKLSTAVAALGVGIAANNALNIAKDFFATANAADTAQRRIKMVSTGLDDYRLVLQTARNASAKFGLSQTEAANAVADIYTRLRPVGFGLSEINAIYEGFNTAVKLSSVEAGAASAAFMQLSQGLGSGTLQGDELRSVLEQMPSIAQAIAKEMDTNVGNIKKFGSEGKITSEVIVRALDRIRTEGAEKLATAMDTPQQKIVALGNAMEDFKVAVASDVAPVVIGAIGQITVAIQNATQFVNDLKTGFGLLASSFSGIGSGIASIYSALDGVIGRFAVLGQSKGLMMLLNFMTLGGANALGSLAGAGAKKNANKPFAAPIGPEMPIRLSMQGLNLGGGGGKTGKAGGRGGAKSVRESQLVEIQAANGLYRSQETIKARIAKAQLDENQAEVLRLQYVDRGVQLLAEAAKIQRDKIPQVEREAQLRGINDKLIASQNQYQREAFMFQKQAMDSFPSYISGIVLAASGYSSVLEYSKQLTVEQQKQKALADGIANTIGQGMTSAFDALISGTESFGTSLRKIASGVLQDIAKQLIQIFVINQAINAISSFFGPKTGGFGGGVKFNPNVFSMGSLLPGRAMGGPVSAGSSYMVGERGPELFTPKHGGNIVPNNALGGGSTNVVVNVDASGSNVQGDQAQAKQLGVVVSAAVQAELVKQQRPGGLLAGTRR